jgi:hypothetical protein
MAWLLHMPQHTNKPEISCLTQQAMAAASREVHKQPFTKGTTATESKGQQYERKRKN